MPGQTAHWRPLPIPPLREQESLRGSEAGQGRSEGVQEVPPRPPGLMVLPNHPSSTAAGTGRAGCGQCWHKAAGAALTAAVHHLAVHPRLSSKRAQTVTTAATPGLPRRIGPGRSALTKMAAAPQRSPSQRWRQPHGRPGAMKQSGSLRMRNCCPAGDHGQEARRAKRGPGGEGGAVVTPRGTARLGLAEARRDGCRSLFPMLRKQRFPGERWVPGRAGAVGAALRWCWARPPS